MIAGRTRSWLMVVVVAELVAGCSSGTKAGSGGVLQVEPAKLAKGCEPYSQPSPLPADSVLLRAGALQQYVKGNDGTLLLSVRFDQGGKPDRVAPLGGTMPDSLRAAAVAAVRKAVIPDKRYAVGSVRVLMGGGAVAVGRSEYCAPVIVSGSAGGESSTVDMPVEQASTIQSPQFSVLVSTSGQIVQSKLVQSSGNRNIDDDLQRGFSTWRLKPARLDGDPIAAWMTIPTR